MIRSLALRTFTPKRFRFHAYTITPSLHLLQVSITNSSLKLTRQSHAQILSVGLTQNPSIATKLITAYTTCRAPKESKLVFDLVQYKSVFLWNSLINGFVKNHAYIDAFNLFKQMCKGTLLPDDFTLSTISKACGEIGELNVGCSIHGKGIRLGCVYDTILSNSLISMYCKCDEFDYSRKVFDEMPQRNSGSWNVMISKYAASRGVEFDKDVCKLFRDMQNEGVKPDPFTVSSILSLCCGHRPTGKLDYGRELHCHIVKNDVNSEMDSSDVHLECCLIDMYSKSNRVVFARRIFDRMIYRNVYAWTAMINGYVNNAKSDKALTIFIEMQRRDGIRPNKVSLVSVVPACSSVDGLMPGKQIHGFAFRNDLIHEVALCNALLDMYFKCGNLSYAPRMFYNDLFGKKDSISWSSMISGYGLHGKGQEAVHLYDEMCRLGIKPDTITIVGVLSACGKSGLVNEGLDIYNKAMKDYMIKPSLEMCACVVDMLGRSGRLDEALDFIQKMPMEPGPSVWGALISASVTYGNTYMQELAYKFLIQLEPENASNYVSMSNVYASLEKWDDVANVRRRMKEKRLKKVAGHSWISINSLTHTFLVADKTHPCSEFIYRMLDDLTSMMKKQASYIVDIS